MLVKIYVISLELGIIILSGWKISRVVLCIVLHSKYSVSYVQMTKDGIGN